MIVVVGGQVSKVGKTRAVCDIISATPDAGWIAVKVTNHAHKPTPSRTSDTGRYLAAGAAEAYLLHGRPPIELPAGANLIIESNSVLDQVSPDLCFFILDPDNDEWKISALRHARCRGVIHVLRRVGPEHIALVRNKLREQST